MYTYVGCTYVNNELFGVIGYPHTRVKSSTFHLTGGVDYETGPYTVTFTAGQLYATLMVSIMDDNTTELSEYFSATITSTDPPSAAEIGSPNMTVITIEDNDPGSFMHN